MTSPRSYRLMVAFLVLMLVTPVVLRSFHWGNWRPLNGVTSQQKTTALSLETWLDGSYQASFDKQAIQAFGVQPPLVRLANQLDYSLFNQANARYVVVGQNNCLYETPYIEAQLGMDFLGTPTLAEYIDKWALVRDTLGKIGVDLDLVLAPGKASYYPEFIPAYYHQYAGDSTNYDVLKNLLNKAAVPYLDFSKWFRSMKDTSSHVLVPLTGIHWSKYGMVLAVDSVTRFWEEQSNKAVADFQWEVGPTSNVVQGSDADVEDGMNLMMNLPKYALNYPTYRFVDSDTPKIRTAVIGDSYYWGLFDVGLTSYACDSSQFWYYFRQVYPESFAENLPIEALDLQAAIERQDRIMLLQTDGTLDRFGFGFVEAAYELYFGASTE